ncbi:MAG: sensor histidine kinase [Gemmatimonadaceae bacterium]
MTKRELGPELTGTTPREQRLAAAGRVAAGLLHEFRNVLGPIGNLAFLMEQQAGNPERVRELAQRLGRLAQVRGRVADRLRDFLQQDAVRFPDDEIVDLSTVARETTALCTTLAVSRPGAAPVHLSCDAGGLLPVRGEGSGLRTAALELILNALDASPQGGAVRVRTCRDGDMAVLEVHDDGPGVAGEAAETLFDPFVSTRDAPDAGLGLPAAWGIAKRHGGDVLLSPASGGGTLAALRVPLSPMAK